jgi:hypothetical protein
LNQNPLAAAGVLIRKFGERIEGGWEIFIPSRMLDELGGNAQIIVEPYFQADGVRLKIFLNKTIEGEWREVTEDGDSGSGCLQHSEADDETPA